MMSLGAILEQFPDEVVIYVTDPRTGIQRRSKWPPTISEVLEACEDHKLHLERLRKIKPLVLNRLPSPTARDLPDGSWARIFVPEGHTRYSSLVKWAETAEKPFWKYGSSSDGRRGIWVSLDAWESRSQKGQ
jgi:hypothetical protein